MVANRPYRNSLDFRLRNQFLMMGTQFLLGMGVNLIGLPDETTGLAHTASQILLVLHVLVAIGLLVGASIILRLADRAGGPVRTFGRVGAGGVGIATLGGILTLSAPGSNWWSFLMAVGFITAVAGYTRLGMAAAARSSQE